MIQDNTLWSSNDIMAYFRVSRSTISAWIRDGVIPKPMKIGPAGYLARWRRSEVIAAIEKHRNEA